MSKDGIAIVLLRNGLELSKACLRTLRAQEPPVGIILAIDNASTDGTTAWLRAQPQLYTMTMSEQVSVAAAWNAGLEWAWHMGATKALVVNNDTELLPHTYQILSRYLDHTIGMATCVSRRERADVELPDDGFTTADHPDFSCFMIARRAWEAMGGFDEGYEIAFCEDAEAHARLWALGIGAISINLPFLHVGSATIKAADPRERRRIAEAAGRNRERFYRRWGRRIGTHGYDDLFTAERFGKGVPTGGA